MSWTNKNWIKNYCDQIDKLLFFCHGEFPFDAIKFKLFYGWKVCRKLCELLTRFYGFLLDIYGITEKIRYWIV